MAVTERWRWRSVAAAVGGCGGRLAVGGWRLAVGGGGGGGGWTLL